MINPPKTNALNTSSLDTSSQDTSSQDTSSLATLEQMLAKTCFCKLREFCEDKNSSECLRNKNIYQEFMQQKHPHAK